MNALYAWFSGFAKKICSVIIYGSFFVSLNLPGFSQSPPSVTNSENYVRLRFVDSEGSAITDVKISPAFFTDGSKDLATAIAQYRSNKDGILSIPRAETKGLISVWAQKRGYVSVQTELDLEKEKTISLELAPLHQGVVLDAMGKPVPMAKVYPYQESDDFRDPGEPYFADDSGQFKIRWKTNKANFIATDGLGNFARITDATFENNVLQLQQPTNLEVTVVDNKGNKLENASIQIRSWERCGSLKFSAVSEGDGVGKFNSVPVGKLGIYVSLEGFRPQWIQIDSAQVKSTQVTLKRPQTIAIQAFDADTDQPISDFNVTGYFSTELKVSEKGPAVPSQLPEKRGWGLRGERGIATTRVERFYDKIDLKVLAYEYSPASVIILDSEEESIDRVVKLQRKPLGEEKVKVLDIDGTPAKDACVMTQREFTSSRVDIYTSKDEEIFNESGRIQFTNDHGVASFDSIPFEGFLIAWNKEGFFQGSFADTDITAPIQLEPYATLRLRLPRFLYSNPLNELESSLPSKIPARVNTGLHPSWIAYPLFKRGENPDLPFGIDETGQIEMKVLPGTPSQIHFTYFQSKNIRTSQPLIEYEANPGEEIEIDLTGTSSIRGKLRFEWGNIIPKQLVAPIIYASVQHANGTVQFQAIVDKNGSFEFSQIPHGEYRLNMSTIATEDDQPKVPQQRRNTVSTSFAKTLTLGESEDCDLGEFDVRLDAPPLNRR